MCIRPAQRAGFTLIEVLVAMALSLIVATVIGLLAYFSSRSFLAMSHYTDMAKNSRLALDKMSMEIRQTRQLTAFATNSLTLLNLDGSTLRFTYDPTARTLVRASGTKTNIYLTDCDALQFWIYQHTVKSNTFDCYDPSVIANARLIEVLWKCSRPIMGVKAVTEDVQSAKIALRNR